jgi:hypothetical protein
MFWLAAIVVLFVLFGVYNGAGTDQLVRHVLGGFTAGLAVVVPLAVFWWIGHKLREKAPRFAWWIGNILFGLGIVIASQFVRLALHMISADADIGPIGVALGTSAFFLMIGWGARVVLVKKPTE